MKFFHGITLFALLAFGMYICVMVAASRFMDIILTFRKKKSQLIIHSRLLSRRDSSATTAHCTSCPHSPSD